MKPNADVQQMVRDKMDPWKQNDTVRRLWKGDVSLWSGGDEDRWLGWLSLPAEMRRNLDPLKRLAADVKQNGFTHVVVLGMGGSSLAPDVWKKSFGKIAGFPELLVLDSTVPAQVRTCEKAIDLKRTLFIVSSKSGSTIEPNVFKQYFLEKVKAAVGADQAGSRFIAVTDPKTKMNEVAEKDRFRQIFFGIPSVGGRFSALSNFGLVPMAAMGVDCGRFLEGAMGMAEACGPQTPAESNPGAMLGAFIGTQPLMGRDKLTFIASPAIASLGGWLEQLVAESTGKSGKGIIPIDGEQIAPPTSYGKDRLFVYLRHKASALKEQDTGIDALENAGHPVVRLEVENPYDLSQQIFCWEMTTAVAGAVLGINPFNQPDVEAAKIAARDLMAAYTEKGQLPAMTPLVTEGGISLFTDAKNAEAVKAKTVAASLAAHLNRLQPGDYFAINAYVEMNAANDKELQALRHAVRDAKKTATTLGYGPRFLHSTGQLHKGGPNTGVFLQLTSDDAEDVPIPGEKFSFGVLKQAQAQGDFDVLAARGRRALRVHLGADVAAGLARLREIVRQSLAR